METSAAGEIYPGTSDNEPFAIENFVRTFKILYKCRHKTLHKDKILFSRTERLSTYPSINRLVSEVRRNTSRGISVNCVFTKAADDDIIIPTLFGGECEDFYDSIPEFCGHNLSDDSFVYPSSMRQELHLNL